mgnify:CR=1 FL=1
MCASPVHTAPTGAKPPPSEECPDEMTEEEMERGKVRGHGVLDLRTGDAWYMTLGRAGFR